jgi:hypothetical protein
MQNACFIERSSLARNNLIILRNTLTSRHKQILIISIIPWPQLLWILGERCDTLGTVNIMRILEKLDVRIEGSSSPIVDTRQLL